MRTRYLCETHSVQFSNVVCAYFPRTKALINPHTHIPYGFSNILASFQSAHSSIEICN